MQRPINYFAVFLVVAAAVTVGNIASHAIQTAFWMVAWKQSIDQFNSEVSRVFGNQKPESEHRDRPLPVAKPEPVPSAQEPGNPTVQQRRANSPTGRKLFVECDVWQRNYDKTPTRTTRQYRDQHCKGYREYIRTGRVPLE
ncbi:hypothetical protein [Salinisphaera sp.]|uniref:hypothetical protein n=1 Tax=Salinisphaera sp. TaxID=1914330 RepID=UPI000C386FD8|nr:hypothetical protein [Salinisphaera sp.]MAS10523.1 hypothetical protein [Salinisphaera sp.]|tara:strand:+ start:6881 stop:7303 length:423 start_codon:yes stop_codon:yes gene_type:complete